MNSKMMPNRTVYGVLLLIPHLIVYIKGQCNDTLKLTAGMEPEFITSPGYDIDRAYFGDIMCRWEIQAQPGTNLLYSLFISRIPCTGDYVTIHYDNNAAVQNSNANCGRGVTFGPYTDRSFSILKIHFVSNSSNDIPWQKVGFRLQYLSTVEETRSGCVNKQKLTATDTPQYLTSPLFPNRYAPFTICEWEISAGSGYDVNMMFLYMDIENSPSCQYDALEVYEVLIHELPVKQFVNAGSSNSSYILCVQNSFKVGNFQGKNFTLLFTSDGTTSRQGFFIRYQAKVEPEKDCDNSTADIVFLLDSSGSVGESNFKFLLNFVKDIISNFNIGPNYVQVGLVTFNTNVTEHFRLNQFYDRVDLINATDNVTYTPGWTYTNLGLNYTYVESFSTANGARPNVDHIVIVLTDGVSNYPFATREIANQMKNSGITIIPIGVGTGVDTPELFSIASKEEYVFRAISFDSLSNIKYSLEKIICKVVGTEKATTVMSSEATFPTVSVDTQSTKTFSFESVTLSLNTTTDSSNQSTVTTIQESTTDFTNTMTSSEEPSTGITTTELFDTQNSTEQITVEMSTILVSETQTTIEETTMATETVTPTELPTPTTDDTQLTTETEQSSASHFSTVTASDTTMGILTSTTDLNTADGSNVTTEKLQHSTSDSSVVSSAYTSTTQHLVNTPTADRKTTPDKSTEYSTHITKKSVPSSETTVATESLTTVNNETSPVPTTTHLISFSTSSQSVTMTTEMPVAKDLHEELVLTRDVIGIISVGTVFTALSIAFCSLLLYLVVTRRRRRKSKEKPPEDTKTEEASALNPTPVIKATAEHIHVYYNMTFNPY